MWILILILSIKLQMPTWYWIIFTAITILRVPIQFILKEIEKGIVEELNKNK